MKHKRYSAFSATGQLLDSAGTAVNIADAAAFATIKFADNSTADLVVTKVTPAEGRYRVTAAGESQRTWVLGKARFDVLFVYENGTVISTKTTDLTVEAGITPLPAPEDIDYPDNDS